MNDLQNYKDKKVLILGLGLNQGGVGSARFFAEAGAIVKVTDLKSAEILKESTDQLKKYDIEYTLGEHKYEDIDWADIIIRNPSLKPNNPYRIYAEKSGKTVETDMGIFLEFVNPMNVIGITGTKGKSTTSTLIYEILKVARVKKQESREEAGKSDPKRSLHEIGQTSKLSQSISTIENSKLKIENYSVVFAGNIGKSILDTIPYLNENTLIVLELSSFQLEAWNEHKVSPHIAVITNVYPDHLDYYGSLEEYTLAKQLIAINQTENDFLILPEDNEIINDTNFTLSLKAEIIRFSAKDLPEYFKPIIKGEHNLPNCAAALRVSGILGLDEQETLETIKNFKGVEFRQQIIKVWNGIEIINDTAATTPDAAIQAIKTFPESILIAGGMNKGLSYEGYAEVIDKFAKSVYFIEGSGTDELIKLMKAKDKIKGIWNNFDEILTAVKDDAEAGDTVVFSPGGTSFNFFQNEFDRGRKFNAAVEKIFL